MNEAKKPKTNEIKRTKQDCETLDLLKRAAAGDREAFEKLEPVLTQRNLIENFGGDLFKQVQKRLIEGVCGQDLLTQLAIRQKLEAMQGELSGPTPTALEKALIERILICWLHLSKIELQAAASTSGSTSLATYFHKAISVAQRRYTMAIRDLAMIRKLALPVLQVNIGMQQINNAGGESAQ